MVEMLGEVVGDWAAEALRAPFRIGTADELADLMRGSFGDVGVERHAGQAHFASLDEWLHTDIRGWTLAEKIDDEQFERLRRAVVRRPDHFVGHDGHIRFAAPAFIATATA